jgi:hypothetical protein
MAAYVMLALAVDICKWKLRTEVQKDKGKSMGDAEECLGDGEAAT